MKIMPAATETEKYKEGPRARPVKGKWRKKKGRKKKGACKHTSVEEEMRAGSNGDGKPQRDGRKNRGEEGRGENRRLKRTGSNGDKDNERCTHRDKTKTGREVEASRGWVE